MQLKEISLKNFRNYKETHACFADKINCFIGRNGSGKTNLLDGIHVLCLSKSHITHLDKENITHLKNKCTLKGTFIKNDFEDKIQCIIEENKNKVLKKNGKQYEKISDHIGIFPLVAIAPNDIFILLSNRKARLKLIDNIISQTNNKYLITLIKYNKILANRNTLLKNGAKSIDLINIYDQELAKYGTYIFNQRTKVINEISEETSNFYKNISMRNYDIDINYQSSVENYEQYMHQLEANLQTELSLGHSIFGIHRDDIIFNINGYEIQKYSSQGQQKSFIIAIKLAQYNYIRKTANVKPILLLDDILDKLDYYRANNLIQKITSDEFGQTFITNTDAGALYKYLKEKEKEKDNSISFFLIKGGDIINYKHEKIT